MKTSMGKIGLSLAACVGLFTAGFHPAYAQIQPNMKVTGQGTQITVDFKQYKSIGAVTLNFIHMAESGDTLWSIARKYGLTVNELASLNQLDPNRVLLVNQRIIIPVKTKSAGAKLASAQEKNSVKVYVVVDDIERKAVKAKESPKRTANAAVHQVKPGETLFSISKRYGVSMEMMAQHNQINSYNHLPSGTTLKVPRIKEYDVKSGDTLLQIARKHNTSIQAITSYNQLKEQNTIKVGQRLKIPQ
ncbi:LysM peptidoglycan-binding domain-containing protein [Ammoniphilus sp. 3BR4]|uniref:LysM peptidoglycan-binding domain-containing protein n=1 Tax=Ammoniphilus sp. 3BR4 TaxID=3158265 RepID=UPI003466DA89